jgi:hypothetical protein
MTTTKATFEDRLLGELRGLVSNGAAASVPVPQRRPRRGRLVFAAGVAAAAVAAVLATTISGGTSNAYAVDSQSDGSVTVHIRSLHDAAGLQSALRNSGIDAVVNYSARCVPGAPPVAAPSGGLTSSGQAPPAGAPEGPTSVRIQLAGNGADSGVTFTLDPGHIDPGQKVFITTFSNRVDALAISIGSKAPTPLCPPPAP